MDKRAVGNNIHRLLKINGITQKRLAEELGVTVATASRWVSGERLPSVYALYRASKYLGVTMETLVEGIEGKE